MILENLRVSISWGGGHSLTSQEVQNNYAGDAMWQ